MRTPRPHLPTNAGTPVKKERKHVATGRRYHRVARPSGKHPGIFPLARSLTEQQIRKVRSHAVAHKLYPLMFACDRALRGSFKAHVAIARWVLVGQATSR